MTAPRRAFFRPREELKRGEERFVRSLVPCLIISALADLSPTRVAEGCALYFPRAKKHSCRSDNSEVGSIVLFDITPNNELIYLVMWEARKEKTD